jgi:hypothetical protein
VALNNPPFPQGGGTLTDLGTIGSTKSNDPQPVFWFVPEQFDSCSAPQKIVQFPNKDAIFAARPEYNDAALKDFELRADHVCEWTMLYPFPFQNIS